MNRRFLPLLFLLLVSGCASHDAPKTLPRDQFVRVYADLTAQGVSAHYAFADTGAARRRADSILAASGVTRDEMMATARSFAENPEQWNAILEQVAVRLQTPDTSKGKAGPGLR